MQLEHWVTLTLAEQLGNIGSDFERAVRWKQKNQPEFFRSTATRLLELLDLTLVDRRWHNHRLKELARVREEVCVALFGEQLDDQSLGGLQRYFLSMASLARRERVLN